ncbi:Matrixin [Aquisphaera giovannonii]|uniref:Matrixin n=1 Tax=Aquisphaera giovannonii TaxID=406548 RepID=A0A5B9VYA8_9BACT|nr:matrixin family metalloprotease [Aquisphaera giovannonii]QEH32715.1 Matrixin [Aquisphaera giovannonii]
MSRDRRRGVKALRPGLEPLEGRRVPAQLGVPWHHPDHVTLSFVPDGTSINGTPSVLFGTLDAAQATPDWQAEILRAFQTWATAAHVNFALTGDGGQPLGTTGPDQGDPRFGDIRIAAVPMAPGVLAISIPHDPFLSGTWSGDILLNSASPSIGRAETLFPVLLHEIGHVLGLGDSSDPASVMFSHLDGQSALAPEDVAAIQSIYGPRAEDPFEGPRWNDTPATASPMPEPAGYDGTTPLLIYANIDSHRDVDFYTLTTPAGYEGPLTIRLQTAGASLLAPHITVLGASGDVLGDVLSTAVGGDTLLVRLPDVRPGERFQIEVQGERGDVFGVGEYVLAASFDARSTVGPGAIDALARQSYSYLSADDIRAIFLDPRGALFHVDDHTNDTFDAAEPLPTAGLYGSEAPDRRTASLSDPGDVDFYRVETPGDLQHPATDGPGLVMTVTVRATEINGIMPAVSVYDADRNLIPALVLAHGDGTDTIQILDGQPDSDYFIRVSSDPTSGKAVGNYDVDVEYGHVPAAPTTFVDASLTRGSSPLSYRVVVVQPQLFDFLLSATGGAAASGGLATMTLTDAQGRVVISRSTALGGTAGGDPIFLAPGVYRASFAVLGGGAGPSETIGIRLYGGSLTDPIGPALDDPTLRPVTVAAAGDPSVALLPILGSADEPYYWLALSLGSRGGTIDGVTPSPADSLAGALTVSGAGMTSAPTRAAMTVREVGWDAGAELVARGGRFSALTRALARYANSTGTAGLAPSGLDSGDGPIPVAEASGPTPNLDTMTGETSPVAMGVAFPGSRPSPPFSAAPAVVGEGATHAEGARQPIPYDARASKETAGIWSDCGSIFAVLGTAAIVCNRLMLAREPDRGVPCVRLVRLPIRIRRPAPGHPGHDGPGRATGDRTPSIRLQKSILSPS